VGLVRRKSGPSGDNDMLTPHVNDRPYAASSFFSFAIFEIVGTALSSWSEDTPARAEH